MVAAAAEAMSEAFQDAMQTSDTEQLVRFIDQAESFGLAESKLGAARRKLQSLLEQQAAAATTLKNAMQTGSDIALLQRAIAEAKECGLPADDNGELMREAKAVMFELGDILGRHRNARKRIRRVFEPSQGESGTEARLVHDRLKPILEESLSKGSTIFFSTQTTSKPPEPLPCVLRSKVLVLLQTKMVLTRPVS